MLPASRRLSSLALSLGVAAASLPAVPVLAAGRPQAAAANRPAATVGADISYPQCPSSRPRGAAFGIVGVNHGLPWSTNPCLAGEYAWAASLAQAPGFYANTADPGPVSSHWNLAGPEACVDPQSYSDTGCAYDYGWNAAAQSFMTVATVVSTTAARTHAWWLDVETANSWNGTAAANAADLQGAYDYLVSRGTPSVGVYSTTYQWGVITGGVVLSGVPDWVAGAADATQAAAMCAPAYSFSGGPVRLTQYIARGFDADWPCP